MVPPTWEFVKQNGRTFYRTSTMMRSMPNSAHDESHTELPGDIETDRQSSAAQPQPAPPANGHPPAPPQAQIAVALKRERERHGLSLSEAAARAGIGKSTLSQLEAGTGNPSVETLWALATSYEVQLSALLDAEVPAVTVVHTDDLPALASSDADYTAALVSPCPPRARRDLYSITCRAGGVRDSAPHPPGTIEHVIVSTGKVRISGPGYSEQLKPGDYVSYPGDQPHQIESLEPVSRLVYLIESY